MDDLRKQPDFHHQRKIPETVFHSRIIRDLITSPAGSGRDYALAHLGAKERAPGLFKLLADRDRYVRCAAADALGAIGAKEQGGEVAKLLKDPEATVRGAAVHAGWVPILRLVVEEAVKRKSVPRVGRETAHLTSDVASASVLAGSRPTARFDRQPDWRAAA